MAVNFFKKYPLGFRGLCVTQTCYNFSFYGLKSIFILYVIAQLSVSKSDAISLFATLLTVAYGTSLMGGWIADNHLGKKPTIILGGLFQALGIFLLMFPVEEIDFFALALIALGSGFFKPTLSTSVGMLFENPRDPAKDNAYSTFYMVMNLGSFIGPLFCGFVSKTYGGYYASLCLIIVTLMGGLYFFYEKVHYKQESYVLKKISFSRLFFIGIGIIAFLFCLKQVFKYHAFFSHLIGVIACGSILYFGTLFYQSSSQERRDLLNISLYIVLFTFFCALFEQAGSSLMLFFDKSVNRQILGIEVPTSVLLSLNPIFVLICSPFLVLFSEKVLEKKRSIDGFIKIGVGFFLTGLSFLILALGCYQEDTLVPLLWVIAAFLIQTMGELLIVPIGYSNISKLSPPRFRSVMMSFWLMAIAYGNYLSGFIAQFSLNEPLPSESSLDHYQTFFLSLAVAPCVVAILLFAFYHRKQLKFLNIQEKSKA